MPYQVHAPREAPICLLNVINRQRKGGVAETDGGCVSLYSVRDCYRRGVATESGRDVSTTALTLSQARRRP